MVPLLLALALASDPAGRNPSRLRFEMTLDGYGGTRGTGGAEMGVGLRGEHLGFRAFFGGGAVGGDGVLSGGMAVNLGTRGRTPRFELDLGVGIHGFSRDKEPGDLSAVLMALGLPVETHEVSGSTAVIPFGQLRAGWAWASRDSRAWFRLGGYLRAMKPTHIDYTETTCVYVFWMGSCVDEARTARYGATSVGLYVSIGGSREMEASPAPRWAAAGVANQ